MLYRENVWYGLCVRVNAEFTNVRCVCVKLQNEKMLCSVKVDAEKVIPGKTLCLCVQPCP